MTHTDSQSKTGGVTSGLYALLADSFVYLVGAAAMGLASFILLPLYTRVLRPAEFGVYFLVDIAILIMVAVTQLKLDVAYLRWYSEGGESRCPELLGTTLAGGLVLSLVGGALLAAFASFPFGRAWFQLTGRSIAWMLLPLVVLENLHGLLMSDLRARRRAVVYCISSTLKLVVMISASIWLVSNLKMGLYGLFLGRLVGDLAAVAVAAAFSLRRKMSVNYTLARSMFRFGLPVTWAGMMLLLLDATGRYFLSRYSTMEQVGYYGIAMKISAVFQLLVAQPFGIAWGGLMFQVAKWRNARQFFGKALTYTFLLGSTLALGLTLFTPTLFRIFTTPAYAPAMRVFPLVLLVRVLTMMEYTAAVGIYVTGQVKYYARIYTGGVVLNMALNFLVTPKFGMIGSVWALVLTWTAMIGSLFVVGQRLYPLQAERKGLVASAALVIIGLFVYSGMSVSKMNWMSQVVVGCLALVMIGSVLIMEIRSVQGEII